MNARKVSIKKCRECPIKRVAIVYWISTCTAQCLKNDLDLFSSCVCVASSDDGRASWVGDCDRETAWSHLYPRHHHRPLHQYCSGSGCTTTTWHNSTHHNIHLCNKTWHNMTKYNTTHNNKIQHQRTEYYSRYQEVGLGSRLWHWNKAM